MRRFAAATLLLLALEACLGDPVGPHGRLTVRAVSSDSLQGAPGRPLPPIALQVVDGEGRPVGGASVAWSVVAGQGRVDQPGEITDAHGVVSAQWVLGTKAGEPQRLVAHVRVGDHLAEASLSAVPVAVEVAAVQFLAETSE